ncbi:hypothetical protein PRK78_007492 [Emydomyces testavorans]|uniref:Cation efflux protein transmembrane domain-containing protein n=1 Tax=Emydomyces testavorans TaxID=2070801 RepID=A0AAF0IMS6_9EURO|nr:hypothetical protein PRK78_007492 [Emydomyces testavorans]
MGCIGLFLNIVSVLVLGLPGHFQLPPTDGHHAHSEGEKQALPEPDVEALKKQSMIGTSLSIKAVLLHIAADAMNNLAVIISDLLMWDSEPQVHDEMESRSTLDPRFYIDPACTLFIAILIMVTTWPLVIRSGKELLRTSETKSIPITIEETDLEKSK